VLLSVPSSRETRASPRSNGELERPPAAARLASRAHTVFQLSRRLPTDASRESAPRASDSSRDSADAAAGHCLSLNRHRLASNAPWEAAQCISATVFEDQSDRCGEALSRRRLCATLSIRTGHFGAIRDEPFAIALNNCREFVSHKAIIARESAGTRGRLTVKLSGRARAPDWSRGCKLSFCTSGDTSEPHGPLERLLDVK